MSADQMQQGLLHTNNVNILSVNKMLIIIIWQKQEQFNLRIILCNWFVPTDVLLVNSDEPNLILLKFACPFYFFSQQLFSTYRNKCCYDRWK